MYAGRAGRLIVRPARVRDRADKAPRSGPFEGGKEVVTCSLRHTQRLPAPATFPVLRDHTSESEGYLVKKCNKRDERLQRATATGWAIFLLAAGAAHAQDTAGDADVQEVIVTGIRAGIEEAIAAKRESGSIVEAVSAEDIGKLPDTSIAESLARLPGLTSQRANGRPSDISVRGTAPGFTTALLNGREQASTGDNRNLEFDQYPSELLSSVMIYKTPDAGLVGQGLAATVDLRTQRPLEYGRRALAFNMRGEKNSNSDLGSDSKDTGFRANFSYIDQFADDTIGLTFGYTHLDSPIAGAGVSRPGTLVDTSSRTSPSLVR